MPAGFRTSVVWWWTMVFHNRTIITECVGTAPFQDPESSESLPIVCGLLGGNEVDY